MSNSPRLPPELTDIIIDLLHYDNATLAACSLVCKNWTHKARYHLFGHVTISKRCLDKFVQSKSTAIPLFRHLQLYSHRHDRWQDDWNHWQDSQLHRFNNIESLTLSDIPWYAMIPCARSAFVTQFQAITKLDLHTYVNEPLICAFPRIETLVLTRITDADLATPLQPALPSRLHTLEVRNCDTRATRVLLAWFRMVKISLRVFRLSDIVLPKSNTLPHTNINSFLKVLGPFLEEFECGPWHGRVSQMLPPISLKHNVWLRTIHFHTFRNHTQTGWIKQMLWQINSTKLVEVGFHVELECMLPFVEWTQLDRTLATPMFSTLRRVRILFARQPAPTTVAWVNCNMPLCYARDILDVSGEY